jgi:hypothetical protein
MKMILAPGGKLRGYIKETSDGKELIAPGGQLLGYWKRDTNQTLLPGGRLLGFGDQLLALLGE